MEPDRRPLSWVDDDLDLLRRRQRRDESALAARYDDERAGRAALAVTSLPQLSPGRAYQFWYFESADKPRVSGGVFKVGGKGDALIAAPLPPGGIDRYQQI